MTLSDVIREVTKLSINSFKWLLLSGVTEWGRGHPMRPNSVQPLPYDILPLPRLPHLVTSQVPENCQLMTRRVTEFFVGAQTLAVSLLQTK